MKRFNVDANAKKSMVSRVGVLAFVALMILNLASGNAFAALEDFKRWKTVDGKQQPALSLLKDEAEIKLGKDLLVTKSDEESFKTWISTKAFVENPVKTVQSALKAAQEAIKAGTFKEFRKAFLENMDKMKPEVFGKTVKGTDQEKMMKKILAELLGKTDKDLSEEELAKLSDKLKDIKDDKEEELLKKLFNDDNSKELALDVTKAKDEKPEEKGLTAEELAKKLAEQEEKFKKMLEEGLAKAKPTETTPPTATTPPAGPPAVPAPNPNVGGGILPGVTGEVADQGLTPAEQQRCDREAKLREDRIAQLARDKEEILAQLGKLEATSLRPGVEQLANNDEGKDDLGALVQKLFAKESPAPFIPPPFQPTQPVASNRDKKQTPFNQPIPQGQPEEPLPPMQFGQSNVNQAPIEVGVNIPVQLGQVESREAKDVLRESESWNSLAKGVSMNSTRQKILFAKNKADARKNRLAIAATNARDAANDMEEQLTAMQKGAESRLSSSTKQAKDQLTQDIAKLQRSVDQAKARGGSVGQNIVARQALEQEVSGLEQQLNAKNDLLTQVNNKIKTEVENGDQNIQMLAKRFKQLNSNASKLEAKRDEQNAEVEMLADLFEQRSQYESQLAMGPQSTGGRNVFQGAQGVQTPRSVNPRANNRGTQVGSTQAGGTELRKPLSNIK